MTTVDLVRAAQSGDERAMRNLHDRFSDRVLRTLLTYAVDHATAEDWAQETWIRVFTALPGFRMEASFTTWLHRITVNAALTGRRRNASRNARELSFTSQPLYEKRSDPQMRLWLEEAISQLPEGMRVVLVLHDIRGYTHDEIGRELGISAGTSKSQLSRGRAKVREFLRPLGGSSGEARAALSA